VHLLIASSKLSLAIKDDLTLVKDHMLDSKKGITKLEQRHEGKVARIPSCLSFPDAEDAL
jgi:hypothetical protein